MSTPHKYSLYEAKARFSEVIRAVRERGETALITWHGRPVAEIRPLSAGAGLEDRIRSLEDAGEIVPPRSSVADVLRSVPMPRGGEGALERFLEERD